MIRLRTHRTRELDDSLLRRLRTGFTNSRYRGDLKDDGSVAGSCFRERLTDCLDYGIPFTDSHWSVLAYDWTELAGWCTLTHHLYDSHRSPFSTPTGVLGFYVAPEHRRKGIASSLVQEASKVARKNGMQRLLANPWNKSSHAFFQSCGFTTLTPYGAPGPGGMSGVSIMEFTSE